MSLIALLLVVVLTAMAAPGQHSDQPSGRIDSAIVNAPSGFTDTVVHALPTPTAMAWTPDGRLLVTQDTGQLRIVDNGVLLEPPAIDLSSRACTHGERGLLGVAVDPSFARNRFVYLYWTHNAHNFCGTKQPDTPENRVTRHVLGADNLLVPSSERVLLDHMPSPNLNHVAGDLNFGADQLLYVSVGDGGCTLTDYSRCAELNTNSRRLDIPLGKILRITRAGKIPATNPYVGAPDARRCASPSGPQPGTGPCTETFASGFRNPFRFVQVPGTSRFYVNDVGQRHWEEINRLRPGRDYGWNVREGHCVNGSYTDCGPTPYENPMHDYSHAATGCGSITGGAFVPEGLWPAPYSGSYLFADYVCGKIFRLVPQAGGDFAQETFMTDVNVPVHLEFGPHGETQALYYLDYGGGAVHRVTYDPGANTGPVAHFWQRPDGLAVTLNASDSYDPDTSDSITAYRWDFGDGETATTTTPRVVHTYPAVQDYLATLTVVDEGGAVSEPFAKTVFAGEHPPAVTITAPAPTSRFTVGEQVTLSASASDPEDGQLPENSFEWTVLLRHGTHTHPYVGPQTGSSITLDYPPPEDLAATRNSNLIATVVATDSRGLTSKAVQGLLPKKVTISFATTPSGGRVVVNGANQRTPVSLVSWPGYVLHVRAPDQSIGGVMHVFDYWSDGGSRSHDIVTPGTAATYTAAFRRR